MAFFPGKKALSTICLYPYPKMRYHYFVTPQSNAIPLRGCLYDAWMTFIGSTMRFVLYSHNKTEGLSMVFAYSCASRLRLPDLRFSIRNEVRFQNEISYKNENIIWNENRNTMSTYQNMTWWMECMKNLSLELLLKNKNLPKKIIKQLRNIIYTKTSWT